MPAEVLGVNPFAAAVLAVVTAGTFSSVRTGAPPPDFDVQTAHGALPLSQLRGRPVVINFWATWCAPCTDELPYFQRLQREYGDRVVVVTISNEDAGVARAYLREHLLALPLIEDPAGKIFTAYKVPPIPDTAVLDPQGTVIYTSVGGLSWEELDAAVQRALAIGTPSSGLLR